MTSNLLNVQLNPGLSPSNALSQIGGGPLIPDLGGAVRAGQEKRQGREADALQADIFKNLVGTKVFDLMKLDSKRGLETIKALGIPLNATDRIKNSIGLVTMSHKLLEAGVPPQQVSDLMGEQSQIMQQGGVDTSLTDGLASNLGSGDPELIAQEREALRLITEEFTPPTETETKIRTETRSRIGTQLKDINKTAGVITTNFNKIQGLIGEVKKGNRTATSQALVAIVKLGDPTSVVKLEEMIGALNTQSPVAAVSDLLRGKNVGSDVINSVTAMIDPLNPGVLRVEDLLNTANALVLANVPIIQDDFATSLENAQTLSKTGRASLFTKGLTNKISALSNLVTPAAPISKKSIAQSSTQELEAEREALLKAQSGN